MYHRGNRKGTAQFIVRPNNGEQEVFVAGDFSKWRPLPMKRQKDGAFAAQVAVAPGTYEYKFIIDGQWVTDPDHSDWAANPFGSMNSVAALR